MELSIALLSIAMFFSGFVLVLSETVFSGTSLIIYGIALLSSSLTIFIIPTPSILVIIITIAAYTILWNITFKSLGYEHT